MEFHPREYQSYILQRTKELVNTSLNPLIELDCGAGKRFLQYMLVKDIFQDRKILLIMQASTSLYETFRYFRDTFKVKDIGMIDSRKSTRQRVYVLKSCRVVICLPQTLFNTVKTNIELLQDFEVCIINEVDQLIRRTSQSYVLKQPYGKLLPLLSHMRIVGMSGTLRDEHYVLDAEQIRIKNELQTLLHEIPNSALISMDEIQDSDFGDFVKKINLIPTGVDDQSIISLTTELEAHIQDFRNQIIEQLENPYLKKQAKQNTQLLLSGSLNVDETLQKKYSQGYLIRKYIWSLPGDVSYRHLLRYGIDASWLGKTIKEIPGKFHVAVDLVSKEKKSVIICSYLASCDLLERMLNARDIPTIKITGRIGHSKRDEALESFKNYDGMMVAIISNVGERDLDIPQAELLIVFDVIRTTKTVYQKLKRIRGGTCRILFYMDTSEEKKVRSVVHKLMDRYPWSTELNQIEYIKK